ncbi:hypothetical protein NL676_001166 [Syzygium grande]|nr:hypothetical protein NL676_001166 [Syzygium grande]
MGNPPLDISAAIDGEFRQGTSSFATVNIVYVIVLDRSMILSANCLVLCLFASFFYSAGFLAVFGFP